MGRRECCDRETAHAPGGLDCFCCCGGSEGLAALFGLEAHIHPIDGVGAVQAFPGAPLGQQPAGVVMEQLNWGYVQLGLVALAFAGLQVWWISSLMRQRDFAKPMTERDFRKSLENIWAKNRPKN